MVALCCIYIYIHTYIHIYTHTYIYYTHICTHLHTCTYVEIYYIYIYICVYIYIYLSLSLSLSLSLFFSSSLCACECLCVRERGEASAAERLSMDAHFVSITRTHNWKPQYSDNLESTIPPIPQDLNAGTYQGRGLTCLVVSLMQDASRVEGAYCLEDS